MIRAIKVPWESQQIPLTTPDFKLMRWLWGSAWCWGLVARRTTMWSEDWNSHSHPLTLHREERLKVESTVNSQWFNQLCLCNEDSLKKRRRTGFGELLGWWACRFRESTTARGRRCPTPLPTYMALYVSSIWLFLCPVVINGCVVSKMFLWVPWATLAC